MRERTKGVSGKGLDFPREALSERERERDGNTLRLGLERRKAFFSPRFNWAAASRAYSRQHREESCGGASPNCTLFTVNTVSLHSNI